MIIEKLKIEDIEQVIELHKTIIPFDITVKSAIEVYNKMLSNSDYFIAVAKENQEIIGSIMGVCCHTLAVPFLVIEDVVVKQGITGKGIGSKLMAAIDDFAKDKRCAYAIIVSSGFRKIAHKFYEKQGFTEEVRGFRKVY